MGNKNCCNTGNEDTKFQVQASDIELATPESSDDEGIDFEKRAEEHKSKEVHDALVQFLKQNSLVPDSAYRKKGKDKKGKMHIPVPEKSVFEGGAEEDIVLLKDLPLKHLQMIDNLNAIYGPFMIPIDRGRVDNKEVFESAPVEFTKLNCYYKGQWRNKKPHGYGVMITEDEDIYEGYFQNGVPYGKGRLFYKNGDYFQGDFAEGKIHGKGKLETATGATIQGNFEDDRLHGRVKEVYRDGSRYEGNNII